METQTLDVDRIIRDFPILDRAIEGKKLIYLDNAATSQKPRAVIRALDEFYSTYNSNIHRGVYRIAEKATAEYENSREKVAKFISAPSAEEIVFTRNTTESLNLVAQSWGRKFVSKGDRIVLTLLEHHSNIVPWQQLALEKKARVEYAVVDEDGNLDLEDFKEKAVGARVVAFTHVSNVFGTINPAKEMARIARKEGALVVVDGAQAVPHMPVDVSEIGCDFYAFSAHKMLGPTGVGVLYGKKERLEETPPFLTGGDMISQVHLSGASWNELPWKFEAGTPNIADVIAYGPALDYLSSIGMEAVRRHEMRLTARALDALRGVEGVKVYGPKGADGRGGVIPFNVKEIHPHDVAAVLDGMGVAVRSGYHCAEPLHEWFGIPSSVRASFYIYNRESDIDALVAGVRKASEVFGS
ncbi:MAG TPA: cysteine desulfurase [Conexivisphaerales archaeon]|nr:cysteine desulfurase [Conexivisphaerales archaeon]